MHAQPSGGSPDVDITYTPGTIQTFDVYDDAGNRLVTVRLQPAVTASATGLGRPPQPGVDVLPARSTLPERGGDVVATVDFADARSLEGVVSFERTPFDASTIRRAFGVDAGQDTLVVQAFHATQVAWSDEFVQVTTLVPRQAVVRGDSGQDYVLGLTGIPGPFVGLGDDPVVDG